MESVFSLRFHTTPRNGRGRHAGGARPVEPLRPRKQSLRSAQTVAGPSDGLDTVVTELLTQIADIDVDDVRAGIVVVAPYVRKQLLAAQHLPSMTEERLRKHELTRRQLQALLAGRYMSRAQIEHDPIRFELIGLAV